MIELNIPEYLEEIRDIQHFKIPVIWIMGSNSFHKIHVY